MPRTQRIRLGAIVFLGLAAVMIACGTLYAIVTPHDSTGVAIVPAALAAVGAAIMIGVALADLRYASMLERRGRR